MRLYWVYIATNRSRTLYTGVTSDLPGRLYKHRHRSIPGFTSKYRIDRLVYFESTPNVRAAIEREKQIKGWRRSKKVELIESMNPMWDDLSSKF
jgi:putative endonuclease